MSTHLGFGPRVQGDKHLGHALSLGIPHSTQSVSECGTRYSSWYIGDDEAEATRTENRKWRTVSLVQQKMLELEICPPCTGSTSDPTVERSYVCNLWCEPTEQN